jgi:hypothetical protein
MNNYREILVHVALRVTLGALVFALGWSLLTGAAGGWLAAPRLMLGLALLVAAAIIVAPALARLVAETTGSLFYPDRRFDGPQPMYGVAQSLRAKGQYEEAMAAFGKIAEEHPREVRPYLEMMDVAATNLQDRKRTDLVLQKGMLAVGNEDDQRMLVRMHEAIVSRMKSPAEEDPDK